MEDQQKPSPKSGNYNFLDNKDIRGRDINARA